MKGKGRPADRRRGRTSRPPSLAAIQRRFLAGVVDSRAAARAAALVAPSRTLTPRERLEIYRRSCFARLLDLLAAEFPTLRRLLGDAAFRRLVGRFLRAHPPRHYSLDRVGRPLPRFLARRPLLRDVARIEDAMAEVFDVVETPVLGRRDFAAIPPERWERTRLLPVGAMRLLELRFNANDLVSAARSGRGRLPAPVRRASRVVVWRRDDRVRREELSPEQFAILDALRRGRTLGGALRAALRRSGDPARVVRGVRRWFRAWVAAGLFSAAR